MPPLSTLRSSLDFVLSNRKRILEGVKCEQGRVGLMSLEAKHGFCKDSNMNASANIVLDSCKEIETALGLYY